MTLSGANFFRTSSVKFGSTTAHFTLSSGGSMALWNRSRRRSFSSDKCCDSHRRRHYFNSVHGNAARGFHRRQYSQYARRRCGRPIYGKPNGQHHECAGRTDSISGTAVNGTDYSSLSGTIAIPATKTSATINVGPVDDALNEDPETVVLQLNAGTSYLVDSQASTATVNIADNDPALVLTINNVAVAEGGTAVFTVSLTPASGRTVSVNFASANGTAHNGLVCVTGTVTLERADGAVWTPVATTTPAAGGAFAFTVRVMGPATFRVSAGTATSTPVTLRPIDLRVGLTTKRRGSTYTLRAGIAPRGSAGVVLFQRYVPELFRWKTIARRHVDRAGHARLVLRAVHRTRIRAVVRTGGTEIASPAVRIGRLPPFG